MSYSGEPKPPEARRVSMPMPLLLMMAAGVILVGVAVVGLALAGRGGAGAPSGPLRVGMRMSNFTLESLDGKPVSLSDFKGRPVLINAWATWCPPCQAEMPDLEAFYRQHQTAGFTILAVNAGETRAQAADFKAQVGMSFPVLLDPDERLMDRLGINDFPTSILVGRDGLVKAVHVGMISPAQLEREILPLIQ